MPNINLLPWRETLKKEREARFLGVTGAALTVMALIVLGVHTYIAMLISYQQARNRYLENEIAEAERKIEEIKTLEGTKAALINRMNAIQDLEAERPRVVHFFDEIVKTLPDGVYYSRIIQRDKKVIFEGIAQSDARVSSLMRNFEKSEWFDAPNIIYIKGVEQDTSTKSGSSKRNISAFKLEVIQTSPDQQPAEDAAATPAAPAKKP